MNEDDTFRLLKRSPYQLVRAEELSAQFSNIHCPLEYYDNQKKILEKYGWTYDEYISETSKNYQWYKWLEVYKNEK